MGMSLGVALDDPVGAGDGFELASWAEPAGWPVGWVNCLYFSGNGTGVSVIFPLVVLSGFGCGLREGARRGFSS
jgi:hypothetical protein